MLITVTCTACSRKSQVNAAARGKRVRCPYPDCRQPFTATAELVPAGAVEVAEGDAPKGESAGGLMIRSWQSEPPPVQTSPMEMGGDGAGEVFAYAGPHLATQVNGKFDYSAYALPNRKGRQLMVILLLVFCVAGGVTGLAIHNRIKAGEAALERRALKEYKEGNLIGARNLFAELRSRFPDSPNDPRYQFMAELTELRQVLQSSDVPTEDTERLVVAFIDRYRENPLYKEHEKELAESMVFFIGAAATEAERLAQPKADAPTLNRAESLFAVGQGLARAGPSIVMSSAPDLSAKLASADLAIRTVKARYELFDALTELERQRPLGALEEAKRRFDAVAQKYPKLAKDPEVHARLQVFRPEAWVRYQLTESSPPALPKEGDGPSLLVCPLVKSGPSAVGAGDETVVLAQARGMLYALSADTGARRWAFRVGSDTHTLPLRLPANPPVPELVLVLAAESNILYALDMSTGRPIWHYPLDQRCPAGPVLLGHRVYLPTAGGQVEIIDTMSGRRIGRFDIGEPLTLPAGADPVTGRLYLPAHQNRVYVLDTARNVCIGFIHTGHTPGGILGRPIIAGTTLVLADAKDLHTVRVRAFVLSAAGTEVGRPEMFEVLGWPWFAPHFDGETLGLATDGGRLALFGLRRGTRDKPMFPLAQPQPVTDERGSGGSALMRGRALVARVELDQWWVILNGGLYRCRFDQYREDLVTMAGEPLPLGTPLHEAQYVPRQRRLVTVTQALDGPRSLATAIDTGTGTIVWQRQLGLVGAQDPMVLGDHVVALDQTGGLYHVPVGKVVPTTADAWLEGGEWLAEGLDTATYARLIKAADGRSGVAVIYDGRAEQVVIRKYEAGKGLVVADRRFRLLSPPAGTPAATDREVVIPCADGRLYQFPLGDGKSPTPLAWRDPNAGPSATGHALLARPDLLLVSDGLRRLNRWERGADGAWVKGQGATELPGRVAGPPVLVTASNGDARLCVGDLEGNLYAFPLDQPTGMRQWQLGAAITDGPFALGDRIAVVLDRRRLVWLAPFGGDPPPRPEFPIGATTALGQPGLDGLLALVWNGQHGAVPKGAHWQYIAGPQGLVGGPHLVGPYVLATEAAGVFTWLDPATGTVRGQHQPRTRLVAMTGPAALGNLGALVPLSDGTILVLPIPK